MKTRDRIARLALGLTDRTIGRRSGRVRAVCRYGQDLIDSGATAEFYALVRHRIGRLRRAPAASARQVRGNGISIDARTDRLNPDGSVGSKDSITFPDGGASVLVAVVIPCFNYGAFLDEAVSSVRAQTLASLEIIVVDDGSTDPETVAVLDRLSASLRVIRQPNQGLPAARNRGIAEAKGEYVCCLDADDRLAPSYLEQAIAVLELDRSVGFAGSWVRNFGDRADVWQTEDFDAARALMGNFTSVASVFRRDDWKEVGGYSRDMIGGFEDWEFWIRLACIGRRGRTIAHPLFLHRRHGRTMTDDAKAMETALRQRMRGLSPAFYEKPAVRDRLTRLVPRHPGAGLATLSSSGVVRPDHRPGLLVVVAGLLNGGAHLLLLDILRGVADDWRLTVLTTDAGPHPLEDAFRTVTPDIVHFDGFVRDDAERLAFLEHLLVSRNAGLLLTSDSLWMLDHLDRVHRANPDLRIVNLIHNHVPTSTFRSGVALANVIDRQVAVSSEVVRALAGAGVERSRIVEIPNGVDVDIFRSTPPDPRRSTPDMFVLLWLGRMSEEKRPLEFIEIVAALQREIPVRGIMCGDGALAGDVEAGIRRRGLDAIVERRGFVPRDSLAALYSEADLLVVTSRVEGMPLVVLEALAAGCPVAATEAGDIGRVVRDGENGLLVPAAAPEALVSRILAFARDSEGRARLGLEAAASLRRSPYQLGIMQAAYRQLFKKLSPTVRPAAVPI